VGRILRVSGIALLVYAGLVALGCLPSSKFRPVSFRARTMGYYIVVVQLPDASSFERTDATVKQVDENRAQDSRHRAHVCHLWLLVVLQANQPNVGAAFLVLDPFDKRPTSRRGDKMIAEIRRQLSVVQEGRVIVLPPPPLRGLGNAGGFKLQVQDLNNAGLAPLEGATRALLDAAQRDPELTSIISGYRPNVPQYHACRSTGARRRAWA